MKRFASHLATLAGLFAVASAANACPPQNENFFISEFQGEEQLSPGLIDTIRSDVERTHVNFVIKEVVLNGGTLCSDSQRGHNCGDTVALKSGPLGDRDQVRVTMHALFADEGEKSDFVFVRSSVVRDRGSLCRPIFAQ